MINNDRRWISLIVLLSAHLLTIIDIFIINVAIPSIQQGISSSDSEIQLVVAMYMIGFASFLIIGGKAGDHYGRKKVFLLGMFLFILSSLGCSVAKTAEILITMRFFQGLSAAFMSPQVLALIQVLFVTHKERTFAIGLYGITIGLGTMLGQFLGGYLVELKPSWLDQPWRYTFLVNIPICITGLILAKVYLTESKDSSSLGMDYSGAVMLSAGLVVLIFSLTIGRDQDTIYFIISLLASLAILTAFVWTQGARHKKKRSFCSISCSSGTKTST
jgi:MFS family permease